VPIELIKTDNYDDRVIELLERDFTTQRVHIFSGLLMTIYPSTLAHIPQPVQLSYLFTIGNHLFSALQFMHDRHICHLDVKPTNIFLSDIGSVLLGDYGAACEIDHYHGEVSVPYYSLKEFSSKAHPMTDMCLLAITLLEMGGFWPDLHQNHMFIPWNMNDLKTAIDRMPNTQQDGDLKIFVLTYLVKPFYSYKGLKLN